MYILTRIVLLLLLTYLLTYLLRGKRFSALEVFLNDMRYINPRFTYLLTYLLTCTHRDVAWCRGLSVCHDHESCENG